MATLTRRLELLKGLDRVAVAQILAAAIPHALPDELEALARAAVASAHPACLRAVLRRLHQLPTSIEDACCATPGPWREVISTLLSEHDPAAKAAATANAIRLMSRRREASLAPSLVPLLDDTAGPLPALAARTLLELTIASAGPHGRRRASEAEAKAIDAAVAAAVREYRGHRRDDTLLAAALLTARPGPALAVLLQDDDLYGPSLRSVVERIDHPVVRGNLLRWLGQEQLQRAAARWINRVEGETAVAELLHDGHLLLSSRRRQFMHRIDRPLRCVPPPEIAVRLPVRAQTHLPLLITRLDLSPRSRLAHLAEMSALPSTAARLRTVGALMAQGEPAASALEAFCFDRDASVARLAAHRFLAPDAVAEEPLLRRMVDGGHPSVARRAAVRIARASIAGFFEQWGTIAEPQRRAAGLGLLRRDPKSFVSALARSIARGRGATQLRAVMLVRRLRLEAQVEDELLRLATAAVATGESPATRVATAAVAALGRGRSGRRVEVLLSALAHPDDRIVANAVEALAAVARGDGSGRDEPGPIVEVMASMARSPRHRARGNAVRGLLRSRSGDGPGELRAMLHDLRPLHRVSGIWVARRSGSPDVKDDLKSLAESDRLPEVRVRAVSALRLFASTGGQP